ncbi:MAG: hypothetical protein CMJ24_12145 [Phycisphaerae bacterium]|nr:hypothetical protein [Phycisphaerae bacterium]|tara:strand:- start:6413 stop:7189 length:777 start_codon:yes stop_codon:yes gene_type:complete
MTDNEQRTLPDAAAVERRIRSFRAAVMRTIIHLYFDFLKLILRSKWYSEGREHIEGINTSFILASNHTGHADTHCILRVLPPDIAKRTAVAAAYDYFGTTKKLSLKRSLIQFCSTAGWNAFGFDRRDQSIRSVKTSARLLRNNWSLLLYPEGTRSRNGRLAHFKPGVSVISRLSRCPVVPTCVTGGAKLFPHGKWFPRPATVRVQFGEPMFARPGQTHEEFTADVEAVVRAMMEGVEAQERTAHGQGSLTTSGSTDRP